MSLTSLTSLRFIAAMMVVLSHLEFLDENRIGPISWLAKNVFREGYVGVTFFFVLSGFILSHSYSTKMREGRGGAQQFVHARIARIFPIHLLTALIALPLALIWRQESSATLAGSLVLNLALLQAWVPRSTWYFSFNTPAWSLSVEFFFYLAFPLLITIRSRTLLWATAALLCLKAGISINADSQNKFLLYIFPPLRLADFIAGILLHRLFSSVGPISNRTATLAQVLSLSALAIAAALSPFVSQGSRFDLYYLAPMGVLILSFAWQNGLISRVISGKTLVLLGEASFSLYMIHRLVIVYGQKILGTTGGSFDVVSAAAYVLSSILLSVAMFKLFELPAKKWVLELLSGNFSARTRRTKATLEDVAELPRKYG
ncbi:MULTISPECIES: acyltransferase [unclassified Massilia]|uniref:acyltransferase family protein n=1 Tax=unclassified Massilia TaxID=2609279 RepID=UPI001786E9F0|nr:MULTISPECIES: acyltransferase [unclassified Massilia]MBD8531503.1 acyltransferase [Massilia sp. CFBP 13647]MBD8673701.1 acyltransferase [Massilia sp. CFBP 13721]